ncbi:ribosomal protein S5 domain 2-type protein [Xylariales sp. PMI_506]|nr:ribosomal protein S5 domain 2-type protein [Xylariales sp. PMI_506]
MSSLRYTSRCLKQVRPGARPQWLSTTTALVHRSKQFTTISTTRNISTSPSTLAGLSNESSPSSDAEPLNSSPTERLFEATKSTISVPYARVVPVSPSYFSRMPIFNDSFIAVQELARKYGRLPIVPRDKVAPTVWRSKEHYRLSIGEEVKARGFATCMKLVKRLNQIHPDLMPEEVVKGLEPFKREVNFHLHKSRPVTIDQHGRTHSVGKRKSSIAQAWVVEGTGEVLVNGKPLTEAFGRLHDRESAIWSLKITERLDKYNVWAKAWGGGTTGQAEALSLAIAKALCGHEPALKNPLRRAGCITRDPRKVERKKAGHIKARKSPAWVKR